MRAQSLISQNQLNCARFRSTPAVAVAAPPFRGAVTHSMPPEKIEVFKSLEGWASQSLLPLLKPVEKCWQPQDFLPDSSLPTVDFSEAVRSLRERTDLLPDEYFVVLVGDMITEEALPTYQTMINTLDGVRDETGASSSPWATWTRAWTAEENRHGDLLARYLYLSGRVDMRMVERTVQYLIGSGMVSSLRPNSPLLLKLNEVNRNFAGSGDGEQPVLGIRLHVIPREGHLHLPRKHCPSGEGKRRRRPRPDMRDHCRGREAARDGVLEDSGEAAGTGPVGGHARNRGHDEEEDQDAGPLDDRRERSGSVR